MTRSIFLLILISTFLTGCWIENTGLPGDEDAEEVLGEQYIFVDHYKQGNCYRVTETFNEWTSYCRSINNFSYEWGYEYELKVNAEKETLPYGVGTYLQYYVLETITKTKVLEGTSFDYYVTEQDITQSDSKYLISNELEFTCEPDDCLYLVSQNKDGISMTLEFLHPDDSTEPFIFNQIKCSAPIASFEVACNTL